MLDCVIASSADGDAGFAIGRVLGPVLVIGWFIWRGISKNDGGGDEK